MQIVVLDDPGSCDDESAWQALRTLGAVHRYPSSTLAEVLDRAQGADILVTRRFPLRREVLDYVTRPRIIVVPATDADRLVERPIAEQLGLTILAVPDDTANPEDSDGCTWLRRVAAAIASLDT